MTTQSADRRRSRGRVHEILAKAWSNPTGMIGFAVLAVLVLLSVFAPLIAPHDPTTQVLADRNAAPSWLDGEGGYLFGTDSLGRDVFSRVLYGLRLSMTIGVVTATISAVLGLLLGVLAGYFERFIGPVLLRLADIQFAIPFIAVGIALTAVLGPGMVPLVIVLSVWSWTIYARTIVRSVSQVRRYDFVVAARTLGASTTRIMLRHIVPSVLGPIIVLWSVSVGVTVLAESGLSLLGLGVQAPGFSLGSMLAEGQSALRLAWWSIAFPGAALLLIVLSFNMIGDALRDALNPGAQIKPQNPELT